MNRIRVWVQIFITEFIHNLYSYQLCLNLEIKFQAITLSTLLELHHGAADAALK